MPRHLPLDRVHLAWHARRDAVESGRRDDVVVLDPYTDVRVLPHRGRDLREELRVARRVRDYVERVLAHVDPRLDRERGPPTVVLRSAPLVRVVHVDPDRMAQRVHVVKTGLEAGVAVA